MVGGTPALHGDDAGQGFDGRGGGEQMAGHALGRTDRIRVARLGRTQLADAGFGHVADRRAGGVGVDVIDLLGIDAGSARAWRMAAMAGSGSGLGITM